MKHAAMLVTCIHWGSQLMCQLQEDSDNQNE